MKASDAVTSQEKINEQPTDQSGGAPAAPRAILRMTPVVASRRRAEDVSWI